MDTGRKKKTRSATYQRITWQHVIVKDTEKGGLSWEEALSLAADRRETGGIGSPNVLVTGRTKV